LSESQEQFTKVLDKLVDSFDDFKERLIRIEENVKDVKNVKSDVEDLKIKQAALKSKTDSAHKRIDTIDEEMTTQTEHTNHDKRIAKLEKIVYWVGTTIIGAVLLAVLAVVIIKP
jgi:t-SNARE complex subunit (syntaxin)